MPGDTLKELLARYPLAFVGAVAVTGSASVSGVPVDERTAVVPVTDVLKAPDALRPAAGARITVQLAADLPLLPPGESAAFFVEPWLYGADLAVRERARLPESEVPAGRTGPAAPGGPGTSPQALLAETAQEEVLAHARACDAVVRGVVVALESAEVSPAASVREHHPLWWVATLAVDLVERGDIVDDGPAGPDAAAEVVRVLYANSLDVRWYTFPKPKAGQSGLWLLHATEPSLRTLAPFQLLHPMDIQPSLQLELLRQNTLGSR